MKGGENARDKSEKKKGERIDWDVSVNRSKCKTETKAEISLR